MIHRQLTHGGGMAARGRRWQSQGRRWVVVPIGARNRGHPDTFDRHAGIAAGTVGERQDLTRISNSDCADARRLAPCALTPPTARLGSHHFLCSTTSGSPCVPSSSFPNPRLVTRGDVRAEEQSDASEASPHPTTPFVCGAGLSGPPRPLRPPRPPRFNSRESGAFRAAVRRSARNDTAWPAALRSG